MPADPHKVALIHATPASIEPAREAFVSEFPEARLWNLVDDGLVGDADKAGGLTDALEARMLRLIEHAIIGDAAAVLLTCSMYGPVTRAASARWDVPIVASDEAMFAQLASAAPQRVGLLGSLSSAVTDTTRRLARFLAEAGVEGVELAGVPCEEAIEAALEGDRQRLLDALLAGARTVDAEPDAFALCQFSLTPVRHELESALGRPVHSPPHVAAAALRSRMAPVTS